MQNIQIFYGGPVMVVVIYFFLRFEFKRIKNCFDDLDLALILFLVFPSYILLLAWFISLIMLGVENISFFVLIISEFCGLYASDYCAYHLFHQNIKHFIKSRISFSTVKFVFGNLFISGHRLIVLP